MGCVVSGFICCYSGCDVSTCPPKTILCDGIGRFVCWEGECCAANGKEPFQVGMVKEEGKICKLGLPCCVQSLFKPEPENLVKCGFDLLLPRAQRAVPIRRRHPSADLRHLRRAVRAEGWTDGVRM